MFGWIWPFIPVLHWGGPVVTWWISLSNNHRLFLPWKQSALKWIDSPSRHTQQVHVLWCLDLLRWKMDGYNHHSMDKCFTHPDWGICFYYWWETRLILTEIEISETSWNGHGYQIAGQNETGLITHGCLSNTMGKLLNRVKKTKKTLESLVSCGQAFHVWLDFMVFNMLCSSQSKWAKESGKEIQVTFSTLSLHWPQL